MSISLGAANGFKVDEIIKEGDKIRLIIESLLNGEKLTVNSFECNSPEETDEIIAEYLAAVMYKFDIGRELSNIERKRLAKKAMSLNIVNGYKIIIEGIYTEKNARNITVELLRNGEFLTYTKRKTISDDNMKKLEEKLNNIVHENLDIKHQYRPIWLEEILVLINQ